MSHRVEDETTNAEKLQEAMDIWKKLRTRAKEAEAKNLALEWDLKKLKEDHELLQLITLKSLAKLESDLASTKEELLDTSRQKRTMLLSTSDPLRGWRMMAMSSGSVFLSLAKISIRIFPKT